MTLSLRQLGPLSRRLLAAQAARDLADLDLIRPATWEACRDDLTTQGSYGRRLLAA